MTQCPDHQNADKHNADKHSTDYPSTNNFGTSHLGAHHCHVHHNTSIDQRIDDAKRHCHKQGGRFTPLRERVYRLILTAGKPLGAYDLINALQQLRTHTPSVSDKNNNTKNNNTDRTIAPPTVYRSLDFLLQHGLIHQLNSISSYVPCCHPRQSHTAAFLICTHCKRVQELSDPPVNELIRHSQAKFHFLVQKSMLELSGVCNDCQASA